MLKLLFSRELLPLFCTQFLGAFNDCVFKNALILLIAFSAFNTKQDPNTLVNISAAIFIIPYFLFSAMAGQLADKFEKSKLIRIIKFAEICLIGLAIIGFYLNNLNLLFIALFLIGTQATFFGPLKYSIIPQHLPETKLMAGNGLIEMGTFIAILLGTIISGILVSIPQIGVMLVMITMALSTIFGFISSFYIPKADTYEPNLKINWSIFKESAKIIKSAYKKKLIFYCIIGISWFWFYGSIFLTQMGNYTRVILNGTEAVTTLLFIAFSVGIGMGSIISAKFSRHKIEMRLVPLGAIGLSLFAIDFSFANGIKPSQIQDAIQFIQQSYNWRILIDTALMGIFGGIYVVPLYTLIQLHSEPQTRSRMVAANNIINAIFMILASVLAILCFKIGLSIPQLFIVTAVLNAINILILMQRIPDFFREFLISSRLH